MGRGRYPARIKTPPPDPQTAQQYLLAWGSGALYFQPEVFPQVTSANIFGNNQPLELEIGCGTGEFVCELAARYPTTNYLGVDLAGKPLYRAVAQAAEQALANIKFMHANVKLIYPLLVAGTLHAVYLHFPVPNMTTRHRKNRIIAPEFFDQMHRVLAPGGRISVITDNAAVFAELMKLAQPDERFRILPAEEYRLAVDAHSKSYFQHRWEQRGRSIMRCELAKRPATTLA